MKKVTVHEPVVIAQSTTAPILHGGFQIPGIRSNGQGEILLTYQAHRDSYQEAHLSAQDPLLKSTDGGKTFTDAEPIDWINADTALANGDRIVFTGQSVITDPPALPVPTVDRSCKVSANRCTAYTMDELKPFFPHWESSFPQRRFKAGSDEPVDETAPVYWKNRPISYFDNGDSRFVVLSGGGSFYVDKDGTVYMPTYGPYIKDDGTMGSHYLCVYLLRSTDNAHSWECISIIPYKEGYNTQNAHDVEGFNESTLQILDDGSFFLIMRSGSLHPFDKGGPDRPAPKLFCTRSHDKGKTWETPKPFYDYGIRPVSVKLGCGTVILASGRPGVYLRICDDPTAETWSDIIPIVTVPEDKIYDAYYEYTCSNCGICAYDDHTAFIIYSDFQLSAPDGKRAKSIVVRRITVEES